MRAWVALQSLRRLHQMHAVQILHRLSETANTTAIELLLLLHPLIMLVVIPPINNMSLGYYVSCCLYCNSVMHVPFPFIVLEVLAFVVFLLFIRTPTAVPKIWEARTSSQTFNPYDSFQARTTPASCVMESLSLVALTRLEPCSTACSAAASCDYEGLFSELCMLRFERKKVDTVEALSCSRNRSTTQETNAHMPLPNLTEALQRLPSDE